MSLATHKKSAKHRNTQSIGKLHKQVPFVPPAPLNPNPPPRAFKP